MKRQEHRDRQERGLVVCAWCGKYLGAMRGVRGISHGICFDCKSRELARWGAANLRASRVAPSYP